MMFIFDEEFWTEFERITFTRALPAYLIIVGIWLIYLALVVR